jgi:hypothetical protein
MKRFVEKLQVHQHHTAKGGPRPHARGHVALAGLAMTLLALGALQPLLAAASCSLPFFSPQTTFAAGLEEHSMYKSVLFFIDRLIRPGVLGTHCHIALATHSASPPVVVSAAVDPEEKLLIISGRDFGQHTADHHLG